MNVFLSCVSKKRDYSCCTSDMYISDLFKKSLAYAIKITNPTNVYVLSAKYGLLELHEQIDPYELTLNTMNKKERKEWANKVLKQCVEKGISFEEETIFLCGRKYREFIMNEFKNSSAPLARMGIGEQLAFYKNNL